MRLVSSPILGLAPASQCRLAFLQLALALVGAQNAVTIVFFADFDKEGKIFRERLDLRLEKPPFQAEIPLRHEQGLPGGMMEKLFLPASGVGRIGQDQVEWIRSWQGQGRAAQHLYRSAELLGVSSDDRGGTGIVLDEGEREGLRASADILRRTMERTRERTKEKQ